MEQAVIPFHPADCGWHRDRHSCGCGLFNTLVYVEPGEEDAVITYHLSVEGQSFDRLPMLPAETMFTPPKMTL